MREELIEAIRAGNVRKFYKSREWREKRREILRRDNYECQKCKKEGRYGRGIVVHHIKHLRDRPDLALDNDNLETQCEACHNIEHPEKLKSLEINKREHITPERW